MHLLQQLQDGGDFSLVERIGKDVPPYAILSHTWGPDEEEVTFNDLMRKEGKSKKGYRKLSFCSKQAKKDGLKFFWVDTCCIDKSSSAELTEAINSMFKWYRRAHKCYVFLSDVSIGSTVASRPSTAVPDAKKLRGWIAKLKKREEQPLVVNQQVWRQDFQSSRWFKRGWTLQELLAPKSVEFFSREGQKIGDRVSLLQDIHSTTGIAIQALKGSPMSQFKVEMRMSWAKGRATKREEDAAYSLLGIFDIHMPLIYGEGREHAFNRLQKEIQDSLRNLSLPSSTVPFRRDDDFVTRDSLEKVRKICARPAGRAALVGLGGVGKSQIAIEYTYQIQDESPTTWAFWLHAGTRARFEDGYRRIAEATKVDGWDEPGADILRLVRSWLCDASKGRWIMVVDNADDSDVFLPPPDDTQVEPLSDFLPQSPNGSILFTSRNQDLAFRLVGHHASIIEVKPMDKDDALVLLQKKIISHANGQDATELVQVLDFMPLAITQAAAFINQRAPRMSILGYLDGFRSSDGDRAELLKNDLGDSRRDGRASNSVISTWQISFEHIRSERPSAAQLLSLMSLFDRQGIPESLLQDWYGQGSRREADTKTEFEKDIHILISYSLMQPSADGSEFEMHRLIQFSTRKWLELSDELEKWKESYVALMDSSYPSGEYENWTVCGPLFPHAQAAVECRPANANAQLAWASVLFKASRYAYEMKHYEISMKMGAASLEARRSILGEDHSETLRSMNSVAATLQQLGNYIAAKEMDQRVVERSEILNGKEHPDTLAYTNNLATVLDQLGEYKSAEQIYWRILKGYKKTLGEDHPDTLNSKNNLALVLSSQGKYAMAEQICQQVLQKREEVFGEDHPDTLLALRNLAGLLHFQKKYDAAELLARRALEGGEKVLGKEHPDTLRSMSILAAAMKNQGRYETAEPLARRALEGCEEVLGKTHIQTLRCVHELAIIFSEQKRYKDALPLYERTKSGYEHAFGTEHPSTVNCSKNYLLILQKIERSN